MDLVDSHAHLESLENLDEALESAQTHGVSKIITIGTDLKSSKTAANLALSCSRPGLDIWAAVGIHPGDGKADVEKNGVFQCIKTLKQIASDSKKVVAIGEAGLDYFDQGDQRPGTSKGEKEYQRELFEAQIKLAQELNLPLVVHCRNGWDEVFEILLGSDPSNKKSPALTKKGRTLKGVFHSFTGGPDDAKKALELGFYISFSGIVTFKNAKEIQEAAKIVPLDKILIETDSPYLAPEPIRGQKNTPGNVKITFDFLSSLRGENPNEFSAQILKNTHELFKI